MVIMARTQRAVSALQAITSCERATPSSDCTMREMLYKTRSDDV
jgi:hypothetical protein